MKFMKSKVPPELNQNLANATFISPGAPRPAPTAPRSLAFPSLKASWMQREGAAPGGRPPPGAALGEGGHQGRSEYLRQAKTCAVPPPAPAPTPPARHGPINTPPREP